MGFISNIRELALPFVLLAATPMLVFAQGSNACDLAAPYGTVDAADVQAAINMTLGISPCTANISGAGVCTVAVVQRVINAALGGACVTGAGAGPHYATLSWSASGSTNVAGYNIYRSAATGGPYTKMNSSLIAVTTYNDVAVLAGQTFYYVITAVDNNGNESAYSNEAQAVIPTP